MKNLLNKAKIAEEVLDYFANKMLNSEEYGESGEFAGVTDIIVVGNKIIVYYDDGDGHERTVSLTPEEWEKL